MEKLSFRTSQVEGPLDLILQLVQKHRLDIYDIEIFSLLEQYMAAIDTMREQDMEVASEFLEMAARLVHIKTLALLPRHEDTHELQELQQELTGQLLEYQACKRAAQELQNRSRLGDIFSRDPMPLRGELALGGELSLRGEGVYRVPHQPSALFAAYLSAVGKQLRRMPPPAAAFTQLVARRVVSVSSRIVVVLHHLYQSGRLPIERLFADSGERSELVATFLALLELVKAGRVAVSDAGEVELLSNIHTPLQITSEGEEETYV